MAGRKLSRGVYDSLITRELRERLERLEGAVARREKLDLAEAAGVLARHLRRVSERALDRLATGREEGQSAGRTNEASLLARVRVVNDLIDSLARHAADDDLRDEQLIETAELLLSAITPSREIGGHEPRHPGIPLSENALLVNARGEHSIGEEIASEIESADRVDLLCSFLMWPGFRLVQPSLRKMLDRGGALRVITTCYMGATHRRVLDRLDELGAEVRVSYDTRRTRLHAKAWLFERESGFSTAYVGSSNLSRAAMLDGLEWNVRLSEVEARALIAKFRATFDGYWEDSEFEPYDSASEGDRRRFDAALRDARGEGAAAGNATTLVDLRPYPFQQEILERLAAERELHDRHRHLVVAATGTGKTVIAALDYAALARSARSRPSLLFIAHREEILNQSRDTFRMALQDREFGELLVGGQRPERGRHVFASIQSLSRLDLRRVPADSFDVVIVDEVHHGAAPTYDRWLRHLEPRELLGLTATPERADGRPILDYFGGCLTVELRLWDALERGLLSPFQYFGIADDTDLRDDRFWKRSGRGGYDLAELERVYTGTDARIRKVITAVRETVTDPAQMRALGFCAGVRHAELMARRFSDAGMPSEWLSAGSSKDKRVEVLQRLQAGALRCVFTVDLFNEGVDLPDVDTVLLLRPTDSATVFIQQIGRGLRRTRDKDCLTILDFIGFAHRKFRFDRRFRAMLAGGGAAESGVGLKQQIERGFPVLPSGCAIRLDRKAQEAVLENLRQQIRTNEQALVDELRQLGADASLADVLSATGLSLGEIYTRRGKSLTRLRRQAGLDLPPAGDDEARLSKSLANLTWWDDVAQLDWLRGFLARPAAPGGAELSRGFTVEDRRRATMLHFVLWGVGKDSPRSVAGSMQRLWAEPSIRREILELTTLRREAADHLALSVPGTSLLAHCRYTRDEILGEWGVLDPARPRAIQTGLVFDETRGAYLLFVTLQKTEKDYSESTMYRDYAISDTLFHWESQNTTRADSKTGLNLRRHREREIGVYLFVREQRRDLRGVTMPYVFLGPVEYVRHRGERPMAITWRLERPMPARLVAASKVVS